MRFFLSDATTPLKYNSCGNLISKQEFQHHSRTFDVFVLILVKEGILYINQNGTEYEVKQDEYIFLNPYEEHFGYKSSIGDLSYYWVHFFPTSKIKIKNNFDEIIQKNIFIMPEYGKISLTQQPFLLFNRLIGLAGSISKPQEQDMILNYTLSLLVMEISRDFSMVYKHIEKNIPPLVSHIKEWIRSNYFQAITVKDIANEFGYNPDYISYLFKQTTNESLIHFINKTRIDLSKILLVNKNMTIKEISYSCGFTDEKYFSKTFKKHTGMTPFQYKKSF